MPIKKGDRISIEYEASHDDGTVFETSKDDGKPMEFVIGEGKTIKGLEDAIIGMEKGEEKKIHLTPSEAYGDYNPDAVKKVPRNKGQDLGTLKPGMSFIVSMPDGVDLPVKIVEIANETITVDFNHPLAGKNLNFKFKIIDYSIPSNDVK